MSSSHSTVLLVPLYGFLMIFFLQFSLFSCPVPFIYLFSFVYIILASDSVSMMSDYTSISGDRHSLQEHTLDASYADNVTGITEFCLSIFTIFSQFQSSKIF